MTSYKHLFFDLDHTLWDHETNVRHTLAEMYHRHKLQARLEGELSAFQQRYHEVNSQKWALYGQGSITKEELRASRFHDTFKSLGFSDQAFSRAFEEEFLAQCPHQTALLPGAIEALEYLAGRNYALHIISNGFAEVQDIKLSKSGLRPYFEHIFTSDRFGVNKPHARVFDQSIRLAGAKSEHSLMIGDNLLADVLGAQRYGIDQVYYNPAGEEHAEQPTFEIAHLSELQTIL